jgi:RsiW-degrading membrane proteinase PrsW (M82 family)
MDLIIPLFALILPFMLWPIEYVFPYPFLVEELVKYLMVLYILNTVEDNMLKVKVAAASGVFFALSETVIYIFNIQLVGSVETIIIRLVLTIPLHVLTYLLILIPGIKDKRLAIVGVVAAMLLHYLFNLTLSNPLAF